jgi:tRNA-2-methylthio-N6-dimethylallyladenosine synthase
LGRIRHLKQKRPQTKVAVMGCIAQQEGEKLLKRVPYVDYVIGPQNIHTLTHIHESDGPLVATSEDELLTERDLPVVRKEKVRAWINIMYGCNNFCSYCIVPFTRGREKSRASDSILQEVRRLLSQGYREVALLGQNVNSYKSTLDFPGLLREIDKIRGIKRTRFITSHPKDLSEELVRVMRNVDSVCEHIHLPLQSGSTRILRSMNRGYSFEEYLSKIQTLRSLIPDVAITSDIIAGFPQETDEDHQATIKALKEAEFDGIFAFKFSPRPGTRASTMSGQLSEPIKSARLTEILSLQDEMTARKNRSLCGTLQEILIEGEGDRGQAKLTGRTRTNKIVHVPSRQDVGAGDIITVRITHANQHSLEGDPL